MSEDQNALVTVKKVDEPTLRITRHALAEHIKLGWRHVEDEVEQLVEAVTEKKSTDDAEKDTKGDDKKSASKK